MGGKGNHNNYILKSLYFFMMSLCHKLIDSGVAFRNLSTNLNPLQYAQRVKLEICFSQMEFYVLLAMSDII